MALIMLRQKRKKKNIYTHGPELEKHLRFGRRKQKVTPFDKKYVEERDEIAERRERIGDVEIDTIAGT